jgi:hypothetical protein
MMEGRHSYVTVIDMRSLIFYDCGIYAMTTPENGYIAFSNYLQVLPLCAHPLSPLT